ncbi:MAG: hypothetical protein JNK12_20460 [Acidimicrobiales bacterium]|nr:hypothetical protein [Acidimicrobiales bacterium]
MSDLDREVSGVRRLAGVCLVLTVGAVTLVGLVAPSRAEAHGSSGAIQLVDSSVSGDLQLFIQVCVAYADEHEADPAAVTVSAQGPDLMEVAVQTMDVDSDEGLRSANLEFPAAGSWTVVVESSDPPASLAVPVTIGVGEAVSPAQSVAIGASTGLACRAPGSDAPTWLIAVGATLAAVLVFGALYLRLGRSGSGAEGAA